MKMLVPVIMCILLGCSPKKALHSEQDQKLIQGNWKSIEDKNWTLHFKSLYFLDSYTGKDPDSILYRIEEISSCNIRYVNESIESTDLAFINTFNPQKRDSTCYEITALDSLNLSIRETSKGKLFSFKKMN